MNKQYFLRTVLVAGTFSAALAAGFAQTAEPKNSAHPGDKYGYDFYVPVPSAFVDGARIVAGRDLTGVSASPGRELNSGVEAAPGKQPGPSAESVRTLAGWDRTGPSAPPERSIEQREIDRVAMSGDGRRSGKFDVSSEGENA